MASVLPRTLSEVIVNVKDTYAHNDITIRGKRLRDALRFLKNILTDFYVLVGRVVLTPPVLKGHRNQ